MGNSVDIFHNERKILSSYDNLFYRKDIGKWEEIKNTQVFKGTKNPNDFSKNDDAYLNSNENDYYIQYEKICNYIKNSEDFTKDGWLNENVSISTFNKIFPNSYCKKIIPNDIYGKHRISYTFDNDVSYNNYWCFSIYVLPNELNYFQLSITSSDDSNGVLGIFSIYLDAAKKLIVNHKIKSIGDTNLFDFDDNCIGIDKITENGFSYYRAFISIKYKENALLKCGFTLLKNEQGIIKDEFSNENIFAGLFINSSQLTKTKEPIEYIKSDGYYNSYLKFKSLYKKNEINEWIEDKSNIYYGTEKPNQSFGQVNDLYFINPLITLSNFNRFGKNDEKKFQEGIIFWNEEKDTYSYISNVDKIIRDKNSDVIIGYIGKKIKLRIDNNHAISHDENIPLKELYLAIIDSGDYINQFAYIDDDNNVYISDGTKIGYSDLNMYNIKFNNRSMYDFRMINNAIAFSTNLFNQTYSTRYISKPQELRFGYNTGGHGNFWDYNNLRRFY